MKSCFFFILFFLLAGLVKGQEDFRFSKRKFETEIAKVKKENVTQFLNAEIKKFSKADPKESIKLLEHILHYVQLHNVKGIKHGQLYLYLGQRYRTDRKFFLARINYSKAQEFFTKTNDISGLQQVYLGYSNLYAQINDNVQAIKFALKAKDLALQIKNDESLGITYNSIANLYRAQNKEDSALFYYEAALQLLSKKNDYTQQAFILDNIAIVFHDTKKPDSAEMYNARALQLAYRNKDKLLELQLLPNTVGIYELSGNFDKQLTAALRAKYLADSMGIDVYKAYSNLNYAAALVNLKEAEKAIPYFKSSIHILVEYRDDFALETLYEELSKAYKDLKQYDSSLHYYTLYAQQKDTLAKKKGVDKVNDILAKVEMDKKEQEINNLNTLNATFRERDALKSLVIYGSAALIFIIVVLLIITFKRFKDNKKLSREIIIKNKALVTKNNEITDSINYAKRIQQALLPADNDLATLFNDSFILYKPKDIVSGDFYWMHKEKDLFFLAVGDCTGHGVPGGFMSMLGHSFLNEVVNEKRIHEPAEVLNQLRDKVIGALRQKGTAGENKDGMDITLLSIDMQGGKLRYAAANNSFYLIRNGAAQEFKADKQPIGYYSSTMRPFTQHTVDILKNDCIYLFTDGYPDQFGGNKGKKFKHNTLQKLLEQNSALPMVKQQKLLFDAFEMWKGRYEQTDDVCIAGLRI